VHGYAGNMIPLIGGWACLGDNQQARVAEAVPCTLMEICFGVGDSPN